MNLNFNFIQINNYNDPDHYTLIDFIDFIILILLLFI